MIFLVSLVLTAASELHSHDQVTSATFQLTNTSRKPVAISEISTTCDCSIPDRPTELEPGETRALNVRVKPPAFGETQVKVFVTASDSEAPLTGHVAVKSSQEAPFVWARPNKSYTVGEIRAVETVQRQLSIMTIEKAGEDPWITTIECEDPNWRIQIENVDDKETYDSGYVERHYSFSVSLDGPISEGPHNPKISFKSGSSEVLTGILRATKVPLYSAHPDILGLLVDSSIGDTPSRELIVHGPDDAIAENTIEVSKELQDILDVTNLAQRRWRIGLKSIPTKNAKGTVFVTTGDARMPRVEIPTFIYVNSQ